MRPRTAATDFDVILIHERMYRGVGRVQGDSLPGGSTVGDVVEEGAEFVGGPHLWTR